MKAYKRLLFGVLTVVLLLSGCGATVTAGLFKSKIGFIGETGKNNMKLYSEGTITLGVVTGISNGYWIQVGDTETGIDVYCKKINCMELPEVGDTVGVTLFKMDYENGMTFGSVENIVRRANRWGSVAA